MGRHHSKQLIGCQGFSLMEIIVAVSLLALSFVLLVQVSTRVLKTKANTEIFYNLDNIIHDAEEQLAKASVKDVMDAAKNHAGWCVTCGETQVVYRDLNKEASGYAHPLQATIVCKGRVVGEYSSVKRVR